MNLAWNTFIAGCRDRYGVATVRDARAAGVAPSTYYRRTVAEGWAEPLRGVRVAPWVRTSPMTDLAALLAAAGPAALAWGETAAWLYDLRERPRQIQVVVPHGARTPSRLREQVRRCRWLRDDDRATVKRLATLTPEAMAVSLAEVAPLDLRARIIDARHRGLVEVPAIAQRVDPVGPIAGRTALRATLADLSEREPESIFHDLVLEELLRRGYAPSPRPVRVETPDGRGAHPDIPLPHLLVAIEVQGDRHHRTRVQRAADRRKTSQYAGTGWLVLQLDWHEWHGDRRHFLAALDAAILNQVARGAAEPGSVPPHLRGRAITRSP